MRKPRELWRYRLARLIELLERLSDGAHDGVDDGVRHGEDKHIGLVPGNEHIAYRELVQNAKHLCAHGDWVWLQIPRDGNVVRLKASRDLVATVLQNGKEVGCAQVARRHPAGWFNCIVCRTVNRSPAKDRSAAIATLYFGHVYKLEYFND